MSVQKAGIIPGMPHAPESSITRATTLGGTAGMEMPRVG